MNSMAACLLSALRIEAGIRLIGAFASSSAVIKRDYFDANELLKRHRSLNDKGILSYLILVNGSQMTGPSEANPQLVGPGR
jgi:hypothetical protein